jgi:hypothetical protein
VELLFLYCFDISYYYKAVEFVKRMNERPNKQTTSRGNAGGAQPGSSFGVVNRAAFKGTAARD